MGKKYLMFFLLPLITYASAYHELKPLPNECYVTQGHIPDTTTISQCFALADLEAKRPRKDMQSYFQADMKMCQNSNNASLLMTTACMQSWSDYTSFYISYPVNKEIIKQLSRPS